MSKKITETRLVTALADDDLITGVDVSDSILETKNIRITKANMLSDYATDSDLSGVAADLGAHESATGPTAHTGMLVTADMDAHKAASNQHPIGGVTGLQAALNAKVASADLGDAAYLDVTQDSLGVARGDRPAAAVAAHVAADAADAHANLPSNAEKAALAGPGVNNPPGAANAYLTEEDQFTEHSQIGGKTTDGHPGSVIETSQTPLDDTDKVLVVSPDGHIGVSSKTADQIGSGGSSGLHADLTDIATSGHPGEVIQVGGAVGMAVTVKADGTLQNSGIAPGGVSGVGEAPTDGQQYARDGLNAQWVPSPVSPIGGLALHYGYTTSTSPTPVLGTVHTNSPADLTLTTVIWVNQTTNLANDASIAWDSYQTGDYIGMWEAASDHGSIIYKLTSPPAKVGSVYTFNVEFIPGSDVNTIDNGNQVVLYQIPSALERVPPGGLNAEALVKASGTDYDTEWAPMPDAGIADAPDANNHVRQQGLWVASDGLYSPEAHSTNTLDGATGHVSAQDRLDWDAAKDHADIDDGNPHGITLADLNGVPNTLTISTTAGQLTGGGALSQNRTLGLAFAAADPGNFTNASITVDDYGRVTAASSGSSSSSDQYFPDRRDVNATGGGTFTVDVDGGAVTVSVTDGNTVTMNAALPTPYDADKEYSVSVDFINSTGADVSVSLNAAIEQMGEYGTLNVAVGFPVSVIMKTRKDGTIQLWRATKVTS